MVVGMVGIDTSGRAESTVAAVNFVARSQQWIGLDSREHFNGRSAANGLLLVTIASGILKSVP